MPVLRMRDRRVVIMAAMTAAFLAVGLGAVFACLSVRQDVTRGVARMTRPLPLWLGNTQPSDGGRHFGIYPFEMGRADVEAVARLLPEEAWTPVIPLSGLIEQMDIHMEDGTLRRIRAKFIARPSYLSMLGLGLVAGRVPPAGEYAVKECSLVSAEVAETLYGGVTAALGRRFTSALTEANVDFTITGVYETPTEMDYYNGAPDLLMLPSDRVRSLTVDTSPFFEPEGVLMAFDPRLTSPSFLRATVMPAIRALHGPDLHLETWSGTNDGERSAEDTAAWGNQTRMPVFYISLFSWLFLLVSCLSVLGFMFVTTTGRSTGIALERALGKSFARLCLEAFTRGALLTLGAAVGGAGIAILLLPVLSSAMASTLGRYYPRSDGVLFLKPLVVCTVSVGAGVLSGLVSLLPLAQLRRAPLMESLKEG